MKTAEVSNTSTSNHSTKSSRVLYIRLLRYVQPYKRNFVFALLATVLAAAADPVFPALMKYLLDGGFSNQKPDYIYLAPLILICIAIVRGVFGFLAAYGMAWVANRVVTDVRQEMFEKLLRLPTTYFDNHPSAVAISKILNDVNGIAAATTHVLTVLLRDTLVVVGLIIWLLYLNWQLTLISLLLIPCVAFVVKSLGLRLRSLSRSAQDGMAQMTQTLQESIRGQKMLKIFGGEKSAIKYFARVNNQLRGYGMRQTVAAAASAPLVHFLVAIALAGIIYIALLQSANDQTTVGGFVSFITAMLMLQAPLRALAEINAPLQRGLAAAESVFSLIDEQSEMDTGTGVLPNVRGRIEFLNLSFRYVGAEKSALNGINLLIEPGQTVALVGASGSGKTTLANLTARFYDPTEGGVFLDDRDLRSVKLSELRRNIAMVGQDVVLFDDSISANIAYGDKEGTSQEKIVIAARTAHAEDFINSLPSGYETMIGEGGARLSGGQRQRIAIARALLKDAPVLILDEATSALDSESERYVQLALESLMQGRTTLVIAHRLSTVERADKIVVLENGQIVEQGTHRALLSIDGYYSKLYKLQFEKDLSA